MALPDILLELDNLKEPLDDHQFVDRIIKACPEPTEESKFEVIAFRFREVGSDEARGNFAPMMIWADEAGNTVNDPDPAHITPAMLAYWERRAQAANNLLMKVRYLGLLWEFTESATGVKPDHRVGTAYVEALLQICDTDSYEHPFVGKQKAVRAYLLARSMNSKELHQRAIVTMVALEDRIGVDEKPGLWGFSFQYLVARKDKTLDEEVRSKLTADLEARLGRLAAAKSPWECESAGVALGSYYRAANRLDDVRRVICIVGNCFVEAANVAEAALASAWLHHAHNLYTSFNMHDAAQQVTRLLSEIGPKMRENMQAFRQQIKVTPEQVEKFLDQLISDDFEDSLLHIAVYFEVSRRKVEAQVLNLAKQFPMQYLFKVTLVDEKGRPVAEVGGINDDLEGRTIQQITQNLQIDSFWLRRTFERLIASFSVNADMLCDSVMSSPLFEANRLPILKSGIEAFLREEYATCIHLLIPQLEAGFRTLVELAGGAVLKANRTGGFQLKNLDDLLRDKVIDATFGEEASFYFRVMLTDQRGWNLRNEVCHGVSAYESFNYATADRVMHILLCLSNAREVGDENPQAQ